MDKNDKDNAKTGFSISSYMTQTVFHVAIEVILACVFFAYFNKKINAQKLESITRIECLETQVKALTEIVKSIGPRDGTTFNNKPMAPTEPLSETIAPGPNIASFLQDFMMGSAMGSPQKQQSSNLPSIIEVDEEPISKEQLDKELSEELGELLVTEEKKE